MGFEEWWNKRRPYYLNGSDEAARDAWTAAQAALQDEWVSAREDGLIQALNAVNSMRGILISKSAAGLAIKKLLTTLAPPTR